MTVNGDDDGTIDTLSVVDGGQAVRVGVVGVDDIGDLTGGDSPQRS